MVPDPRIAPLSFLPSPSINGFHLGPLFIHFYGLMYVIGIALAVYITRRRLQAAGGNPAIVADMATWAVPAGIIGGRIYFDITTPHDIPHVWYGVFAVWTGGLGIWGGILGGALAGAWRVRRSGESVRLVMDAIAPALLVAQAVGRIGNYFNQELFGKPTSLPWGLEISYAARVNSGIPASYLKFSTFQPTFLYELIWDLALAAFLVWLGHHRKIKPPGLFALYVAGYSAFRIFEESIRIDSSEHFFGFRLNFYVATILTLTGLTWFIKSQRRPTPTNDTSAASETGRTGGDTATAGPEPGKVRPDGLETGEVNGTSGAEPGKTKPDGLETGEVNGTSGAEPGKAKPDGLETSEVNGTSGAEAGEARPDVIEASEVNGTGGVKASGVQ